MDGRRYVLTSDNDGHDYIIPADRADEFSEWLDTCDGYSEDTMRFDSFRLGTSVWCITFADPRWRNGDPVIP